MAGYLPVDTPPGTAPLPLGQPAPGVKSGGGGRFGGKQAPPFTKGHGGRVGGKHKAGKGKGPARPIGSKR